MIEFCEFSDRQLLAKKLAEHIGSALQEDISKLGRASLVVSGGSTPIALFQQLATLSLPWQQVVITLADERWVEASSPDSNESLVRQYLLQEQAAAATFVSLKNAAETAEAGCIECEKGLQDIPRPFTTVILGMGNDGHTASLFPDAAQLSHAVDSTSKKLCAAIKPQTAPHQRMTLTLPALLDAKEIILHLTGGEKKVVLEQALANGPAEAMPIRFILRQKKVPVTVYWAA
jgi:6-phosphogluconolactonase